MFRAFLAPLDTTWVFSLAFRARIESVRVPTLFSLPLRASPFPHFRVFFRSMSAFEHFRKLRLSRYACVNAVPSFGLVFGEAGMGRVPIMIEMSPVTGRET